MSLIKSLAMIVIAAAIVFHALVPRYEVTASVTIRDVAVTRIDRWTGNVEFRVLTNGGLERAASDGDWLTVTRGAEDGS
jgi:hypothetical protein